MYDEFLTEVQVCKMLQISKPTLYKEVKLGKIIPVKLSGRVVRYRQSQILETYSSNKK